MITLGTTPSAMRLWTSPDWRDWLQVLFDEAYQREMQCGYDEKIGMAAVGMLIHAVRRATENGLSPDPDLAMRTMVHAMFSAYVVCESDGIESSGRSSMGSVFNTMLCQLPDSFAYLHDEWQWVCTHRQLPASFT